MIFKRLISPCKISKISNFLFFQFWSKMNVFVKWRIFCNNLEPFEHDRKTFLNKSNKTKIVSIKFTETRLTFCCYNTISWSIINRPASRIVHDWAFKTCHLLSFISSGIFNPADCNSTQVGMNLCMIQSKGISGKIWKIVWPLIGFKTYRFDLKPCLCNFL